MYFIQTKEAFVLKLAIIKADAEPQSIYRTTLELFMSIIYLLSPLSSFYLFLSFYFLLSLMGTLLIL